MGWCSATEIMDTAVRAALDMFAGSTTLNYVQLTNEQREILRPFVSRVAHELRSRDWDCIEESDYFDDFPQEMLGHDDVQHLQWKREQLSDWDGTPDVWPRWAGPVPVVVCDPTAGA